MPGIPDQFSVNNRRYTVREVTGHFVNITGALTVSTQGSVVNRSVAGPHDNEAVAAGFDQMGSGGTVICSCIVGKKTDCNSVGGFIYGGNENISG